MLYIQILYTQNSQWSLFINARPTYDSKIFLGSLFLRYFQIYYIVLAQKIFMIFQKLPILSLLC